MKMKPQINKIYKTKDEFNPLFQKGEKFKVIEIIADIQNFLPIVAVNKNGEVYGFEENELEECN